ncbi:VOC family protein [Mucilaginibacter sp. McL0603]|uniref:VOC family protein n=1 Tax=Mucilaginibacter sp. McL0603 TaxID=3415670 RepID=UPI003CF9AAB9
MRNTMYWVEIPAKNFDRAKNFYETIFGITMNLVPIPRGKYAIFPLEMEGQGAGGAIVEGDGYEPNEKGAIIYMDRGEDLSIPLSRIEKAGGKILLPKSKNGANGEFGFIAHFIDSEGNRMGLHSNI